MPTIEIGDNLGCLMIILIIAVSITLIAIFSPEVLYLEK
jgi:hypothetical protein